MSLFLGIIIALVVFFIVVFLHELGHFLAARWSGVHVHEFGIGIPPRLVRLFRDKKWTEWTLNWLPLGGFVRLKWEDSSSLESQDADSLARVSPWKQLIILLAGVTMNFVLAGLIFSFLFYRGTLPLTVHIRDMAPHSLLSRVGEGTRLIPIYDTLADADAAGVVKKQSGVVLSRIVPDSVAQSAGLLEGDIILSVDGVTLDTPASLSWILATSPDLHTLRIDRGGVLSDVSLIPLEGKIGAYISPAIVINSYQYPLPHAFLYGMQEAYDQTLFSFRSLGAMITTQLSSTATVTEKKEVTNSVGGPIALGRVFVSLVDHGVDLPSVLTLMALISLSLCVFNLLPFPALDGGRVFIILVNLVIRSVAPRYQISPKWEQVIHSLGFIFLIWLSILVAWKDIFTG